MDLAPSLPESFRGLGDDRENRIVPAVWAGLKSKIEIAVKKETREVRDKMVVVRMNETEYKTFEKLAGKTTCRNHSEYLRKVSLQEPVTIKYRNQSADDFLAEMIRLKNELSAVGNNFNQAVHKLHTLEKIPEFRTWIMLYESSKQNIENKIAEINAKVLKMYNTWSQK